jgi:hypothetical protein
VAHDAVVVVAVEPVRVAIRDADVRVWDVVAVEVRPPTTRSDVETTSRLLPVASDGDTGKPVPVGVD